MKCAHGNDAVCKKYLMRAQSILKSDLQATLETTRYQMESPLKAAVQSSNLFFAVQCDLLSCCAVQFAASLCSAICFLAVQCDAGAWHSSHGHRRAGGGCG
jgi:hypothetical protein